MMFKTLLKSYTKDQGFVRYQIDSYNDFVNNRIQEVVDEIGEITPDSDKLGDFKVELGQIRIGKPGKKEADGSVREILPMEARLRDINYAAPLFLEMTPIVDGNKRETSEVQIGELPIMVKSDLCPLSDMNDEELVEINEDPDDPGGYFIVNGTERVLVLVEEIAPNRMIVEQVDKNKVKESARINSESKGWTQRHTVARREDGLWVINFANVKKLPLVILLRGLGLETDKEIIQSIAQEDKYSEEIYSNLYESDITDVQEALEYIGKKMKVSQKEQRVERAENSIDKYLLPHIGQNPEDRLRKAKYLGRVARKLMELGHGDVEEDDIDHYANKRLRTAGDLLEVLLRSILLGRWGLIARINYNYQKIAKRGKVPPVSTVVEGDVLTNQLVSSLATGRWVGGRTGVSQRLERTNFNRSVTHLRNVISPLSTSQEHFEARELHATHLGRLCTSQTPEGPTIGLRKYLALMAQISSGYEKEEVENIIKNMKTQVKT
ncbi:MAG: DNA-directed RNA polymerase subunit B'' [Candidatus Aenigmatarchaeota archaeon]